MSDPEGSGSSKCVVAPRLPGPRRWGTRVIVVILIFVEFLPISAGLRADVRPYLLSAAVLQLLQALSEMFRNLTSRIVSVIRRLAPMRLELNREAGSRKLVLRWL